MSKLLDPLLERASTGERDTTRTFQPRNVESGIKLLNQNSGDLGSVIFITREIHESANILRRDVLVGELEDQARAFQRRSGAELLSSISSAGLSWRDLARVCRVSVPAVQKWRRNEGMTAESRETLARLASLIALLSKHLIEEPVPWLEAKVLANVGLARLDLLAAGRFDLVLALAAGNDSRPTVESILDEYQKDWRDTYVDNQFMVIIDTDGMSSIVPRA